MTWDAKKLEWNGLVDFDGEAWTCEGVADHVLVSLYLPYLSNDVQPFGWFASKVAASSGVLVDIITKAMVKLHSCGEIVKNVVSDGCSSNKSAMGKLGVNTDLNAINGHYIKHPMDDKCVCSFSTMSHTL